MLVKQCCEKCFIFANNASFPHLKQQKSIYVSPYRPDGVFPVLRGEASQSSVFALSRVFHVSLEIKTGKYHNTLGHGGGWQEGG